MNALSPSPIFPSNPSVGQRVGSWVWNGVRWVSSPTTGIQVATTVFTSSGPYMPAAGLVTVTVECYGAGGGGGGAGTVAQTNEIVSGAGGGSGGRSTKTLPAALVAGGVQVTIGAGGTAGAPTGQAGNGGATTFGALCVANGGMGGWAIYPSVTSPEPGRGAAPGVGDLAAPGATGANGSWLVLAAGQVNETVGSPLGGTIGLGGNQGVMIGAGPSGSSTPGLASLNNTGAGGGGGVINQAASTNVAGGAGGSGICIVTEYLWADAGDGGDCDAINVNARVAVTHVPWQGPGPCPPGWGAQNALGWEGEGE